MSRPTISDHGLTRSEDENRADYYYEFLRTWVDVDEIIINSQSFYTGRYFPLSMIIHRDSSC